MNINSFTSKYGIGQLVVLVTDPNHHERMVCQITFTGDQKRYMVMLAELESWHYEFELTDPLPEAEQAGFLITDKIVNT